MRVCECGNSIPSTATIGGKRRNLKNRTKCLECLPFGQSRFRKKSLEERRSKNAEKARKHYHKRKKKLGGVDPIRWFREQRKVEIVNSLGSECQLCGYNKTMRNLVFHHLFDKSFPLSSRAFQYSIKAVLREIEKCILVCHNCHGEIHDLLIDESIIKQAHRQLLQRLKLVDRLKVESIKASSCKGESN